MRVCTYEEGWRGQGWLDWVEGEQATREAQAKRHARLRLTSHVGNRFFAFPAHQRKSRS